MSKTIEVKMVLSVEAVELLLAMAKFDKVSMPANIPQQESLKELIGLHLVRREIINGIHWYVLTGCGIDTVKSLREQYRLDVAVRLEKFGNEQTNVSI